MHVSGLAEQRRLGSDERVVDIAVHGGDVVALLARLEHQLVHAEPAQEHLDLGVPVRDVDPEEAARRRAQRFFRVSRADTVAVDV